MAVGTLRELERSYFDLRWHMDPVAATQAGVTTYDDRYGQYTVPALAAHLSALKSLATALEETTSDLVDDEIDRTALLNEIRVTLRVYEVERPQARSPEFWLSHLLGGLHQLLLRADQGGEGAPEARAVALVGRLDQVPQLIEDARATLTEPVRVFAETGLRMAEGGLALIREATAGAGGGGGGLGGGGGDRWGPARGGARGRRPRLWGGGVSLPRLATPGAPPGAPAGVGSRSRGAPRPGPRSGGGVCGGTPAGRGG